MLRKPLDVDTESLVLSDFMTLFWSLVNRNKEVLDSFVINLKHRNIDFVLFLRVIISPDSIEDLFTRNGHDSFIGSISDHGIRLSGACLSICEETAVITFPGVG